MNSTAPIGQKQLGRLAETRMGNHTMPAAGGKRAPTAATSKPVGKQVYSN